MGELTEEVDRARKILSDTFTVPIGEGRFMLMGEVYEFSSIVLDMCRAEAFLRAKATLEDSIDRMIQVRDA